MSAQPIQVLRCSLPCDASAPQLARQALAPLDEIQPVHDEALLIASELVTNAILHSGCDSTDEVEVAAELRPGRFRIAVTDPGHTTRMPAPRNHPGAHGGFGLKIVEKLARRWGSERDHGLRVWAELAL